MILFDGILVLDTGFSSQDLADIMQTDMRFIMPFLSVVYFQEMFHFFQVMVTT